MRYEHPQAYREHVKKMDAGRGRELVSGSEGFVDETEALVGQEDGLDSVPSWRRA